VAAARRRARRPPVVQGTAASRPPQGRGPRQRETNSRPTLI